MTHAPAPEHPIPSALRTLWDEARDWVDFILSKFDRAAMRTTGIRREPGARLSIWLGGVESAVRRLILTAALALTPASLHTGRRTPPARSRSAQPHAASFRIFHIHGAGAPTRRTPPPRPSAPYSHIRFPADPILALGQRLNQRGGHNGGPPLQRTRRRNPLDRWVRLSRRDPDWRPPEAQPRTDRPTQPRASARPQRHAPQVLPDSLYDWRRHHDEWQRLVPAPALAARLDAIERITANPGAAILRAARRLQGVRERTLALARAARPATRPPRRARHVATMGHAPNFALTCHDMLADSDTS